MGFDDYNRLVIRFGFFLGAGRPYDLIAEDSILDSAESGTRDAARKVMAGRDPTGRLIIRHAVANMFSELAESYSDEVMARMRR